MRPFYIKALLIFGIFLMPSFGFADAAPALPAACTDTYSNVDIAAGEEATDGDDFIFAGDNNSIQIDGGNGNDCILVGNNNTADISGGNGNDVLIVGDNNTGNVEGVNGNDIIIIGSTNTGEISGDGENGDDSVKVGDNNSGDIFGGNGADTITVGKNNEGNISGENGDDDITIDCGNTGAVDGDFKKIPCLPTASPSPGTYTKIQNISLSSEDSESIYYSTDLTTPACSPVAGALYESPIKIFSTKTIKAIGCSAEGLASDIASFAYTIEKIEAAPLDLQTLLTENVFVPTGSVSAATKVSVAQNIEIKVASSSESKIILEKDLEISHIDGEAFDANLLTSSEAEASSLTGLAEGSVVKGALQWGIPNTGLKFSKPITVSIFVGAELNGQTLNVVRSVTGTGDWINDGIEPPATCTVADGICVFQATKASYYVVYGEEEKESPPPQTNNSSGGGSSGGGVPCHCIPEIEREIERQAAVEQELNKGLVDSIAQDGTIPESTPLPLETPSPQPVIEKVAMAIPVVKTISESGSSPANIRKLQGILRVSDNEDRGNLMLVFGNSTAYIKTSRNFSDLVDKNVIISVDGSLDKFILLQIDRSAADIASSVEEQRPALEETDAQYNDKPRQRDDRLFVPSFFASIGRLIFRLLSLN